MNALFKGIDVSHWQGDIDWQKVKNAGIQFAILKVGDGDDIRSQDDDKFEKNVAGCEAVGIPWGAYLYSYALNLNEAQSELNHLLRLLKGKKPSFPIALDMEDSDGYKKKHGMPSNDMLVRICETVLLGLESNGYYASLYASKSWLDNQLNDRRLDRFDKWVAQWYTECTYQGAHGLWQYGGSTNPIESPYVDGINGKVDKDFSYYDYPQIMKEKGLNGWQKEEPREVPEFTPAIPIEEPIEETQEEIPQNPTEEKSEEKSEEKAEEKTELADEENTKRNILSAIAAFLENILKIIKSILAKKDV